MTNPDVDAFLASAGTPEADPLIVRGRYQIVPADGDKAKPHTRVTNFAKKLEDESWLTKWKQRQVLLGAAQRSDLVASALAFSDDTRKLDELADEAQNAAKSHVKRETGTALHRILERVDAGEVLTLPEPYKSDSNAYRQLLADLRAEVDLIEAVIVHKRLNLAGRFDRTVIIDGVRYIADLKTGDDLKYSWGSIAIQLAVYQDADTIYDPDKKRHTPMPETDRSRALVIHLPAGSGKCQAYWVNLEAGRRGMALVSELLSYRRDAKTFAVTKPQPFPARPELREYVENRVRDLITDGFGADLAKLWPADVPTLKAYPLHDERQLDLILVACNIIEGRAGLQFSAYRDPRAMTS